MSWLKVATLAIVIAFPGITNASGLADLEAALNRLNGDSPISVILQTEIQDIEGSGEEQTVKPGQASVLLNDSQGGLQVTYSNDVLALIDSESKQKVLDEDVDTPTLNAVNSFDATLLRSMLSAADSLQRRLSRAQYIEEKPVLYQGLPARVLVFDLPLEAILSDKQARKYVKTFDGQFTITIDDDGTPLESRLDFAGKGRAFLVLRIEAAVSEVDKYQVIGQRLLRVSSLSDSSYSTTFGDGRYIKADTLLLADNTERSRL